MDLTDLKVFQTVAELGTITEAAKRLNYVQSNVTSRIQKLEQYLDTTLFLRHRRGMSLTPEGRTLMNYSKKILALSEEMEKVLQSKTEPAGELNIGAIQTIIKLPHILNEFNRKYHRVELSLYTGVTKNLQEDVLDYKLDGAFVVETDPHPELEAYSVYNEELVLISHPSITTLKEAKKEPFLCFSKGCAYRRQYQQWHQDENTEPNKIMELGTFETILSSVVIGLGTTFVPKSSVKKLLQKGTVISHSLPRKYSHIHTVFIRRKDVAKTTTIEKFIETIDYVRNLPYEPITY